MFLVVGSLICSPNRTQGCRKTRQGYLFHMTAVIPHKTTQQAHARLVTTLELRHSCINTRPLPGYPRNLSVTLLQTRPPSILTKPPSFTRDLRHTTVNTTDSRDYSLNTPGKKNHLNTRPVRLYTLQRKILELSGSTK